MAQFYRLTCISTDGNATEPWSRFVAANGEDAAIAAAVADAATSGLSIQVTGVQEIESDIVIGS